MSVNSMQRDHFFGTGEGRAYSRENPDPTSASPVVDPDAPQVAGAPANPIAIAEPKDPIGKPVTITYDENGNVEQANVGPGQVDAPLVAGGAQPHFTNDPKPDDVRRGYTPTHQAPGDLFSQQQAMQANQRAAVQRSEQPKESSARKSTKK